MELSPSSVTRPLYVQTPSTSQYWPFAHDHEGYRIVLVENNIAYPQQYTQLPKLSKITATLGSPANLHIYSSIGEHTGMINSVEKECSIPNSSYFNHYTVVTEGGTEVFPEKIIVFDPIDDYFYEIVGNEEGTYRLEISYTNGENKNVFKAKDIPTSLGAKHIYVVDWAALVAGEEGVYLEIDADRDGTFERSVIADSELTADEFLGVPIADAGADQTAYTWFGDVAEVTLDGSGSNDPDGDELTYQWTWTINGDIYNATGVNPTIGLPSGKHTITLVVNDGITDSEPDEVVITVVEVMESECCWVFPPIINRYRGASEILAVLRLPEGITKDQVALDMPLVLYPGGIEANRQNAVQWYKRRKVYTSVFAFFDKDALMAAVPDDGRVELEIYGQLNSGQYFYGTDNVRIISRGLWFSWWDFYDDF